MRKTVFIFFILILSSGLLFADDDIFKAVSDGNLTEVKSILEKNPELIHSKDRNETTPIHFAALQENKDIVEFLLEKGADVNAKNTYGYYPLHYSVMRRFFEITSLLVEKGADVNAQNIWGLAPLHRAAYDSMYKEAELLIQHGADINIRNDRGQTPLFYALRSNDSAMVDFLISKGADINAEDEWDRRLLHIAAFENRLEFIQSLIEKGAEIDAADKSGQTPLHRAAIAGYLSVVKLLVENGASLNISDNDNRTPYYYAVNYHHKNVAIWVKDKVKVKLSGKFDYFDFNDQKVKNGEAIIWYLGHSGWAIKTQNNFLIFDYYENNDRPDLPMLTNGYITTEEIKDLNVYVFSSHEHSDHFDKKIMDWEKSLNNVKYIFGWKAFEEPKYIYMDFRKTLKLEDLEITSVHSADAGKLEGNFLVKVDGLVIYHSGDYSRGHETFKMDMKYLAEIAPKIDLFFMLAGNKMDNEEAFVALDIVKPQRMFPMHAGGNEYVFKKMQDEAKSKGNETQIILPNNRGDRFLYRNGEIMTHSF